jgi:integrase
MDDQRLRPEQMGDSRKMSSQDSASAGDLVKRNVALLCDLPKGQPGRPSKSLTREQAGRLLRAAGDNPTMNAYVVLSLLTGARTEELRALIWSRVNLDGNRPTIDL